MSSDVICHHTRPVHTTPYYHTTPSLTYNTRTIIRVVQWHSGTVEQWSAVGQKLSTHWSLCAARWWLWTHEKWRSRPQKGSFITSVVAPFLFFSTGCWSHMIPPSSQSCISMTIDQLIQSSSRFSCAHTANWPLLERNALAEIPLAPMGWWTPSTAPVSPGCLSSSVSVLRRRRRCWWESHSWNTRTPFEQAIVHVVKDKPMTRDFITLKRNKGKSFI